MPILSYSNIQTQAALAARRATIACGLKLEEVRKIAQQISLELFWIAELRSAIPQNTNVSSVELRLVFYRTIGNK